MTNEQQAAYINAMAACVIAEVAAMQAANAVQNPAPYKEDDFKNLIERYGIHHNSVMSFFIT